MADVTVRLTLGSFTAEITGPQEYVDKKLDELTSKYLSPGRSLTQETKPSSAIAQPVGGKKVSPGEFLKLANPRNQSDQGMVLGYFLEKVEDMTGFTSTELGNLARDIKRPFGNPSDVVAKLTARGLMMSSGDKEGQRAYALTASGEEYVESMIEAKP